MTVDRKSVEDMSQLIEIMNGKSNSESSPPPTENETRKPHVDPNVDAMKSILEKFTGATENVVRESENDEVLRQATQTYKTERGAVVGKWEIEIVQEDNQKTYNVRNVETHETIAEDLYLYEAAYGLTVELNKGKKINDASIRKILEAENSFYKHRMDALTLRKRQKRLQKQGKKTEAAVAEDRSYEAKYKAVQLRRKLQEQFGI